MGSLLKLSPAARPEPLSGQYQIDGASGSENSFMIDGLETSNFRTGTLNVNNNLPFEFIQEMSIKTSGVQRRVRWRDRRRDQRGDQERHQLVPRHGRDRVQNDSLNGNPRGILNKFRSGTGASFVQINEYLPVKTTYKNYYPVFGIGGPILRDKAWFFASYSPQIFDEERTTEYFTTDPRTRTKTAEETYNRTRTSDYFQGRVDAAAAQHAAPDGHVHVQPVRGRRHSSRTTPGISLGNTPPSVNFGGSTGTLVGSDLTTSRVESRRPTTSRSVARGRPAVVWW